MVAVIGTAIGANALGSIALLPFDADTHNREVVIFGTFHIVSRQYAQATGIGFEAIIKAVFHTEIGHFGLSILGHCMRVKCKAKIRASDR